MKDYSYRIQEMNEIAKLSGGKILDEEWKGVKHRYSFKLDDGSIKRMLYGNIIRRKRLGKYSIRVSPAKNLENIKNIAIKNGGKLLSSKWLGRTVAHEFECDGVYFKCTPKMLKRGQWAPKRGLVSENIFRQALEHLFGYPFIKTQNLLTKEITNRKKSLELDGYCKQLKIAFEYQGHPSHWNPIDKNFLKVNERDLVKKQSCNKLGVKLIIIPMLKECANKWSEENIMLKLLPAIKKSYDKEDMPNLNVNNFIIDFSIIKSNKERLDELKKFALNNGGVLISTAWKNYSYKYSFQYKDGRMFKISLTNLRANGWPKNLDNYLNHSEGHKKTPESLLEELSCFAKNNNGRLLSTKWQGTKFKYLFEKENGEQFQRKQENIKTIAWPK